MPSTRLPHRGRCPRDSEVIGETNTGRVLERRSGVDRHRVLCRTRRPSFVPTAMRASDIGTGPLTGLGMRLRDRDSGYVTQHSVSTRAVENCRESFRFIPSFWYLLH